MKDGVTYWKDKYLTLLEKHIALTELIEKNLSPKLKKKILTAPKGTGKSQGK
jgi:hypothetical protein